MPDQPELERLIALQERLLAAVGNAESTPEKLREIGAALDEAAEAARTALADGVPEGAGELFLNARRLAASLVEATRLESTRVEHSLERVRKLSKEVRRRDATPAQSSSCDIAG